MMELMPRDEFARVFVTLWAIWYAHQKIIHEEEFQSPLSTHLFIENYLRDLSIVKTVKIPEGGWVKPVYPRWLPPQPRCVKLNVDAAMVKSASGGAVGVVCRSDSGEFMGASSLTMQGISDPTVMEAREA
jgi:hypothetical protein